MVINKDTTNVTIITSRQKRSSLKNSNVSLNFNDVALKLTRNEKVL